MAAEGVQQIALPAVVEQPPQVAALTSWMWTFGSSATGKRSLPESPVVSPRDPQW